MIGQPELFTDQANLSIPAALSQIRGHLRAGMTGANNDTFSLHNRLPNVTTRRALARRGRSTGARAHYRMNRRYKNSASCALVSAGRARPEARGSGLSVAGRLHVTITSAREHEPEVKGLRSKGLGQRTMTPGEFTICLGRGMTPPGAAPARPVSAAFDVF